MQGSLSGTRVRGIVFDMDGVLLLSSSIHAEAYTRALAGYSIPPIVYSELAGMRTDEAIRLVLSRAGIAASADEIAVLSARKSQIARTMLTESNPVAPGTMELIPLLAREYPLALASSASRPSVELFLSTTRLAPQFRVILTGADVERAKPHPDIYEKACAGLGFAASECLIIEDAASGVRAGKAAGALVWGLPETPAAASDLRHAGADRILGNLSDLRELAEASQCH